MTFKPTSQKEQTKSKTSGSRTSSNAVTRKVTDFIKSVRRKLEDLENESETETIRHRYGYGLVKVDLDVTFRTTDVNGRLHIVGVIAAEEIDGVFAYFIDDTVVYPTQLGGSGSGAGQVQNGRFKNIVRLRSFLGKANQTADPDLVAQSRARSNFHGKNIAYVWFRGTASQFSSDPKLSVIARMRKPRDPRGTEQIWTINPYVQIYDLLTKDKNRGGGGLSDDDLDLESFQTAVNNVQDTVQPTQSYTRKALATTTAINVLQFDNPIIEFQYGDVVRVSGNHPGTLSSGTDYWVIPFKHIVGDADTVVEIKLASSFANSMKGTAISFGQVTKDFNVTKVGELKFHTSFTYRSNEPPASQIARLLDSCGAALVEDDGKIKFLPQVYPDEIDAVTLSDLAGPIQIRTRRANDERATELTGTYTSIVNLFAPADYGKVNGGGIYEAADGQKSPKRFDNDIVGKQSVAQREATIILRRLNQEVGITFPGHLSLYRLKAGTVFTLDASNFGLDENTPFQVQEWTFFVNINDGTPFCGIDIVADQLEAGTFDLSISDETLFTAAQIPEFADPGRVEQPGNLTATEELFITTRGAGVRTKVTLAWVASQDPFLRTYRPAYKLSSASAFIPLPDRPETSAEILDLAPGTYDFQVQAINRLNVESEPTQVLNRVILGLSAPPSVPTGFNGQPIGSAGVLLTWNRSSDLDVVIGGQVEIRHHPDTAGGQSANANSLASVDGNIAVTVVPFKLGTYYLRFLDQDDNPSAFAEWSTQDVRPVPFGQLITSGAFVANDSVEDQVTIQEDPTFPSSNPSNTLVVDSDNEWLTLAPGETFDDIADIDAIADVDDVGSEVSVSPEGVYFFSSGIALNAVTRMLIETQLESFLFEVPSLVYASAWSDDTDFDDPVPFAQTWTDALSNSIDLVPNIDELANVDGAAVPGSADAWIEARLTRDDPTGSPTWGPWERIDSKIVNHRGVEFRVQARSYDPAVNIRITAARVLVREIVTDPEV